MTAPRSAGRKEKVPISYVFRCASNVADLPIWLGKCRGKTLRDRRIQTDRTEKWPGGNKNIGFYICFAFCTLIARSMTSESMRPKNDPQKALHEAVCEASEQQNRAVAAVRLILGKICSFESSDRYQRVYDLQKNA